MSEVTKMVLLDKFADGVIDSNDFISVEGIQEFVGKPVFEFVFEEDSVAGEFTEIGTIATISVDEEEETLTVNGKTSYYDDFDFDFEDGEPVGVFILELDELFQDLEVDLDDGLDESGLEGLDEEDPVI